LSWLIAAAKTADLPLVGEHAEDCLNGNACLSGDIGDTDGTFQESDTALGSENIYTTDDKLCQLRSRTPQASQKLLFAVVGDIHIAESPVSAPSVPLPFNVG
jgi:hypothetical protein